MSFENRISKTGASHQLTTTGLWDAHDDMPITSLYISN